MGCEGCGDKQIALQNEKLIADAKKQAQKEGKAIAICRGEKPQDRFFIDAYEAARTGQVIVDIVHYMQ